jgi:hypothetical protein
VSRVVPFRVPVANSPVIGCAVSRIRLRIDSLQVRMQCSLEEDKPQEKWETCTVEGGEVGGYHCTL